MRRYSDKTVKLAAKRVRRGVREMPKWGISNGEQVEILVAQLVRQRLEPIDIVRTTGEDAVIAIARAIQRPREVDVEQGTAGTGLPGHVVIDSVPFEFEPGKFMNMPRRRYLMPEISNTWKRVIERVMQTPGWFKS